MARIPEKYRGPLFGRLEKSFRNSLAASSTLGLLFLIAVLVAPKPDPTPPSIEEMPERLAKLILERPKPKKAPGPAPSRTLEDQKPQLIQEQPKPTSKPSQPAPRRAEQPKLSESRGQVGRERAQEQVTTKVAQVTRSLDASLDKLAQALPAAGTSSESSAAQRARGRNRRVQHGRGSSDIGQVAELSSSANASVGESLGSATVSLGSEEEFVIESGGSGSSSASGSGGGGELRSNSSLLDVVRRYAAGIQYCYDDELKSSPQLRGKLVVSITVAADGSVRHAQAVQDKLGSDAVRDCVLAQIRGWRFPEIATGEVSFQTPFVFTPGG